MGSYAALGTARQVDAASFARFWRGIPGNGSFVGADHPALADPQTLIDAPLIQLISKT